MENPPLSKASVSFGLSLAVTSVLNAVITVVKEKSPAVMNGMAKLTGHHWTTHVLIVLVLFVVFALIFGTERGGRGRTITAGRLIGTIVSGIAVASLIIVGFYLIGD